MTHKWTRRKFTKAVISAQALLASGALVLPMGCSDTKNTKAPATLDSSRQETLKFAMDEIIPANTKMPSASEIGGVNYVLKILEELPDLEPLFISLTDKIRAKSLQQFGHAFSKLNKEKRIAILIFIEQHEPQLFKVLKDFTYESYYTSTEVYDLIGYEPHPTGTMGPQMLPFDEKLLDRVKSGPSLYTKI